MLVRGNLRSIVQGARLFGSSATRNEVHPVYFKHKERQKKFKDALHLPVHRKAGFRDDAIRYLTYAMAIGVILKSANIIYTLSVPPKNEE